ncbi:MAG: hypothetical protein D6679_04575 [Candidatus Hydrogenedentota bacterium]|nr:MAG: hypothetical protein D6679_04575 [Candidatus Hydrogenedentota bacterium]
MLGGGIFGSVLSTKAVVLSNNDLAGNWNLAAGYATGVASGTITFQNGAPFGRRSAGVDTVVFDDGQTDVSGAGALISLNEVAESYVVFSDGTFMADTTEAGLAGKLVDTSPQDRVVGAIADTGANGIFFALRLLANGTDDLYVGIARNSLDSSQIAKKGDTFIGAALFNAPGYPGGPDVAVFALGRNDTFFTVSTMNLGATTPDSKIGGTADTSGIGGMFVFRPDSALTEWAAGDLSNFDDTSAEYRVIVSADTSLGVIVRDTTPLAQREQLIAFMVDPEPALDTALLFGPWQAGAAIAETGALNATMGFFEFRGDGTGSFNNGEPPPGMFIDTDVRYLVKEDDLGGILSAPQKYYEVTFRPGPEPPVTARFYLARGARFAIAFGDTNADEFIAVAARRLNAVNNHFSFGAPDTPIQEQGLAVGMVVETGATEAPPTFSMSQLDSSNVLIQNFEALRDTDVRNAGVETIAVAVSIVPDTTILDPDSVIITLDLRGSSADTGNGTFLVPLVFNDSTGLWERVPESLIVSRENGIVTYHAPHFSVQGGGNGSSSSSTTVAKSDNVCLIAASPVLTRVLPVMLLRFARDGVLDSMAGRSLVTFYYGKFVAGGLFLFFGVFLAMAARRRRKEG